MKKIIGLVLLIFIASRCIGKIDRATIFSLCSDPTLKWIRDDSKFSTLERALSYPNKVHVVGTRIKKTMVWSYKYNEYIADTTIILRGVYHTWNCDIKFNDFYNGYNLKQ